MPHVATTREKGLDVMMMTPLRQVMGGGSGGSIGTCKVLQQLLVVVLLALNVKVGLEIGERHKLSKADPVPS